MPRRSPFSFATLYVHLQPALTGSFPTPGDLPAGMQVLLDRLARPSELSVSERLMGLKRLFDDEVERNEAVAV